MNRALISLLILALAASSVHAQSSGKGQGHGMRGPGQGQRMQHMQQALGLSQEQVDQIRSIRQNGGGRDEVRAVLSDEQRTMMDEHRAARQGQGGPGKWGNRPRRGNGNGAGQSPAQSDSSDTGNG
jgi:Spy/CpxP family protein refolding chaperone